MNSYRLTIFRMCLLLSLFFESKISFSQDELASVAQKPQEQKTIIHEDYHLVEEQTVKMNKDKIKLINLNHYVNKWFLLKRTGRVYKHFHVENRDSRNKIYLTKQGFYIVGANHKAKFCKLWSGDTNFWTLNMEQQTFPYYEICDGMLFIRIYKDSNTKLSLTESTTKWLRNHKFGESVVNFVKPFMLELQMEENLGVSQFELVHHDWSQDFPLNANVKNYSKNLAVSKDHHLGFSIQNDYENILFGLWYKSKMHQGVFVNIFTPRLINEDILESHKDKVKEIGKKELDSVVYMTAYDLDQYYPNYIIGTQHPTIDRGFEHNKHIANIGSIPPFDVLNSVGVFIGGFKSRHGYFKYGPHQGKVYGYIEGGVELQKMEPKLATIIVRLNEEVEIIEWPEQPLEIAKLRKHVISARQNGTLIIKDGEPGEYVSSWAKGNWSGSAKGELRSLRSGICIQENHHKKFLIFMAFYGATPSTMARVMQSLSCQNGMHLDMNAHMYLHNAIYQIEEGQYHVEYLHKEMIYPKDIKIHRFIMDNNERDFFYIKKRSVH